jgi:hypothetical protein
MLDQSKRKATKDIWDFSGLGDPGAKSSYLMGLKL